MRIKLRRFFNGHLNAQWSAYIMLVLGIGGIFVGYLQQHIYQDWLNFLDNAVADFYANVSSELISISITVLIIERANKNYSQQERKEELVLQMGSRDNTFATEAVRILRLKKWHSDHSLSHAHFQRANLNDVDLGEAILDHSDLTAALLNNAKLENASLIEAKMGAVQMVQAKLHNCNLSSAFLYNINLTEANLTSINFQNATLEKANFQGAWIANADLRNTNLRGANFDNAALLADLRGADLSQASLQGTCLWIVCHKNGSFSSSDQIFPPHSELITKYDKSELLQAIFDSTTVLPNGRYWTPSTDMKEFIHPEQQVEDTN